MSVDDDVLVFYLYGIKEENLMRLNPKEQEKLMLHMAGMLAKERKFTYKEAIEGTVTGIPNTFILYFSIKAVEKLPAYIVFPAYSAGVIFVVNIVNYFLFKEKLSKEEKIATVLVAIALILINI